MNIGLYFGSFNPVHTGHLIIANFFAWNIDLDQVWFVVSTQNPFKKKGQLLNEYDRLHLVELAIEGNDRLRASNIEFNMPKPSYTIDTLAYMHEKYPSHRFTLIMGSDNLQQVHKWKNADTLTRDYNIYVYRRRGHETSRFTNMPTVRVFDVPLLDISASFIRKLIGKNKSIRYLVPESVRLYIEEMGLFK